MRIFLRIIDAASEWSGKFASFFVAVLVVAICYDISMRYLFAKPTSWAFDMTYMLYGAYTMMGAAYCHLFKGHVRMDLLYGRLSPRGRAISDAICYMILFFPLFIVLVWKCGGNAIYALTTAERSHASVWRPYLAPFKLFIALGFVLFFLQGLAEFIRSLYIAFKGEPHES